MNRPTHGGDSADPLASPFPGGQAGSSPLLTGPHSHSSPGPAFPAAGGSGGRTEPAVLLELCLRALEDRDPDLLESILVSAGGQRELLESCLAVRARLESLGRLLRQGDGR